MAGKGPVVNAAKMNEVHREDVMMLGQALGLNPAFIAQVQARGQGAVIDRAEMVDQRGAQTRLLAMVQALGIFLQEAVGSGGDTREGVVAEAIVAIAQHHQVSPRVGLMLVGSVLEAFQQAAASAAEGMTGNAEPSPETAGQSRRRPGP